MKKTSDKNNSNPSRNIELELLNQEFDYNKENENENPVQNKKPLKGLISTIIVGLILIYNLYRTVIILGIKRFEHTEDLGYIDYHVVVFIFASLFLSGIYVIAESLISLIFTIRNMNSENKTIRIINIVYTTLLCFMILAIILKLLLLRIGY